MALSDYSIRSRDWLYFFTHFLIFMLYSILCPPKKQQAAAKNPPKYIVRDGKSRIWEMSLTRQKPSEMVHIYILDNAVFVTSWKKNLNTGKTRMVVDKYWSLVDIGIVDVKDSAGESFRN